MFAKPPHPSHHRNRSQDLSAAEAKRLRKELLHQLELHQAELDEQRQFFQTDLAKKLSEQESYLENYYRFELERMRDTLAEAQLSCKDYRRQLKQSLFKCQEVKEENLVLTMAHQKAAREMDTMAATIKAREGK
ncbi:hypothetical protein PGT21_000761 [Puccinia graminis f. sp. tritici]|nr:hypothetical protein PGT21_000761 [Puccinia graminis f. sp. tritici]